MDFSVGDAIKRGWEIFKSRPWFFVGAVVILLIASFVVGLITEAIDAMIGGGAPVNPEDPTPGSLVGGVINFLLTTLINMGAVAFFLKAYDNLAATSYGDLWHPQPYLSYLAVSILLSLIVGIGLVLLIVPGLFAIVVFFYSPFMVIDRNMGPIEALKASMEMTKGYRWKLFGLLLAVIGINLLGALALLVGLFVTIPVTTLALIHVYRLIGGGAAARVPVDAAYA